MENYALYAKSPKILGKDRGILWFKRAIWKADDRGKARVRSFRFVTPHEIITNPVVDTHKGLHVWCVYGGLVVR